MIARVWRGITPAAKADDYLAYLDATGLKEYRATAGNRGVQVLRRIAGDDYERAVYYPEDGAYLRAFAPGVEHYEVVG